MLIPFNFITYENRTDNTGKYYAFLKQNELFKRNTNAAIGGNGQFMKNVALTFDLDR